MRKEKCVTIDGPEGSRDLGKVFWITEMSAVQAEAWGTRALLALARSGVALPDNFTEMGLAGMAVVGVQALGGLNYETAKPLLAEMLACVQACPTPGNTVIRRALVDDDTEEVATLLFLRKEVINLHVDFFTSGSLRKQATAALRPAQS